MRVLTLDPVPSSTRGGQEKSLFDILKGFRINNIEVDLLYEEWGDYLTEYNRVGVGVFKIGSLNFKKCFSNPIHIKSVFSFLLKEKKKYDIIYINEITELPFAWLFSKIFSSKIICHLRLPPNIKTNNFYKSKFNLIGAFINSVDAFIVANLKMKFLYTSVGLNDNKIKVIPNGFWVDKMPNFQEKKIKSVKKIVYLGRITPQKGILELIEIFEKLIELNYDLYLDIIGDVMNKKQRDYLLKLKKRIKTNNLQERVTFVGQTKTPLETLYKYDLTIFPSIWEEPFGRVLFESIYSYTPVIGNDVGSVSTIILDEKKEWTYCSKNEAVRKIISFIESPGKYNINEKREIILKNYNLNYIIKDLIDVCGK
ncbi:glycosyltransferase [Flammeovirga yaeyamensis]|uniref:Glycosyltransferase n=1 Tax=Flammeovirga yaeyamensis TaxID=367791 RepID=A0AAX1MXW4_9BACT|nr:glycosyltransferase family 4 protein [Flammeovirga yaeyamensis]MBB3696336.1 glycosyltransferase involved in cell wall biosynthesis [Flammeovirga yaeyamensis]NMF35015.1 glycosyltransferase family 4 protein [Flammeovirga yaeyamensis]QWG00159.1 glycosyltransferase [Flammeovirga yaeyamensis]